MIANYCLQVADWFACRLEQWIAYPVGLLSFFLSFFLLSVWFINAWKRLLILARSYVRSKVRSVSCLILKQRHVNNLRFCVQEYVQYFFTYAYVIILYQPKLYFVGWINILIALRCIQTVSNPITWLWVTWGPIVKQNFWLEKRLEKRL